MQPGPMRIEVHVQWVRDCALRFKLHISHLWSLQRVGVSVLLNLWSWGIQSKFWEMELIIHETLHIICVKFLFKIFDVGLICSLMSFRSNVSSSLIWCNSEYHVADLNEGYDRLESTVLMTIRATHCLLYRCHCWGSNLAKEKWSSLTKQKVPCYQPSLCVVVEARILIKCAHKGGIGTTWFKRHMKDYVTQVFCKLVVCKSDGFQRATQ